MFFGGFGVDVNVVDMVWVSFVGKNVRGCLFSVVGEHVEILMTGTGCLE